jgi:hypothetical protein
LTSFNQPKLTRVMAGLDGLIPHSYVAYKQSQLCRCGHLHQWTSMMAETHIKSVVGGKYVTNHRACRVDDIKYNLPIKVIDGQTEHVMFCHECYATASLAHLPQAPSPTDVTMAPLTDPRSMGIMKTVPPRTRHWKDGSERYEEAEPKVAKAKKPIVTIDDLLI